MTNLVCLEAFTEASHDLENARLRCGKAAAVLISSRNRLDQAVERAYQQQSFGPIKTLFDEEEAALAIYEQARAELAQAQERWCALQAALVYERELMLAAPLSRNRLN